MGKEKIRGVINNNDNWERNDIEMKSAIEKAVDKYYVSCEEIGIVAKTISLILMLPNVNDTSVSFKSLGYVCKDTREISIWYKSNNLNFDEKDINIIDQDILNDDGAIKILNRFLYNLSFCSKVERKQYMSMLAESFNNCISKYKEFPGTFLKLFKYTRIDFFNGKIIIFISKYKKSLKVLSDLEN